MACRVMKELPGFENFNLAGMVSKSKPEEDLNSEYHTSLDEFTASADLLIDFTLPGGPRDAAEWCARNGVAMLSGTTGLKNDDIGAMKKAAEKVPVLWAPNLSPGVALVNSLVSQAAAALGNDADVQIAETHHKHKLDAPSGTALALGASVMEGRGERLRDLLDPAYLESLKDTDDGGLSFSSVREGEVIGEHTVRFTMADEVIEISHKALRREVFAKGALKAGEWLVKQAPGYYSTRDWLGLG